MSCAAGSGGPAPGGGIAPGPCPAVAGLRAEGARLFPDWAAIGADSRPLPEAVPPGVRYGDLTVDMISLPDAISADDRLAPPDDLSGQLPAFLPFPDRCSVVLKARDDGRAAAVNALQAMMLRFLTGLPPGMDGLPVTVATLVFQGPVIRYGLRDASGGEIVAHVECEDRDTSIRVGDRVWAGWDPGAARLLPPDA